jgi:purine-binding chemotaxis protein CheW
MSGNLRKYLIFTLAGRRFAFDLAQVAEVVEQPVTWPIPLAPSCYRGAMNFHGTIVAVMDLGEFFGLPAIQGTGHVIVLDIRLASLAFVAESILRIVLLDQDDISPPQGDDAFAVGELSLPEGKAILLDASAISAHAADTINS